MHLASLRQRGKRFDNHCEFCSICQLPPGLCRSLYVKDDNHPLSLPYGNFTTLTRLTEPDLDESALRGALLCRLDSF